jgi:hypothetical protein
MYPANRIRAGQAVIPGGGQHRYHSNNVVSGGILERERERVMVTAVGRGETVCADNNVMAISAKTGSAKSVR